MLLAVDDAHWSDEPTVDALAFLVPRLEHLPVVLLFAMRPPDLDAQPRLAGIAADPVAEVGRPTAWCPRGRLETVEHNRDE